ncbi:hypothetical protein ACTOV4_02655 [Brucella sp. C7-11G]
MEGVYKPEDPKHVARVVNDIVRQFDNTGTVTLKTSATSTVVMNPKVVASTVPLLIPADANSKAEQWFIQSVGLVNLQSDMQAQRQLENSFTYYTEYNGS